MRKIVVFSIVLALVAVPSLVIAGYLVNDSKKECLVVGENPGIGIAGYRYSDTCPDDYSVVFQGPVEKPWYVKLLEVLDTWFGLKSRVLWVPSAGQIAFVSALVLALRRFLQLPLFGALFDRLTHGVGTLIISFVVSTLTNIQGYLDGGLTVWELALAIFSTVAGAAVFWESLKRLVRKSEGIS